MKNVQELIEKWIEKTVEVTFSHKRNSVDVMLWDNDGDLIEKVKDVSADIFLCFFEYNKHQSDDKDLIDNFLRNVL